MAHGGRRPGAGRKPKFRNPKVLYVKVESDPEAGSVEQQLQELAKRHNLDSLSDAVRFCINQTLKEELDYEG